MANPRRLRGATAIVTGPGRGLRFALEVDSDLPSPPDLPGQPPIVVIARERTPSGNFQGAIEALPFDDDGFDPVTGFNAFQYAGDAARALRAAGRVTRPSGRSSS